MQDTSGPDGQTARVEAGIVAEVVGASKRYPGVQALDNVDFAIRAGEVRALLGKNGAGKSTLIRLLTGAETQDSGDVRVMGKLLEQEGELRTREAGEAGVQAVYQELSLIPGMSVAENMFLGSWPQKLGVIDHARMEREAGEALARLGLRIDTRREVALLAPAHRQLVEIARALMGRPRLVILDEPTSSLHVNEVGLVFSAVRTLAESGIAIIYVSHRMSEIRQLATSATVIRDGRIIETVSVQEADTRTIVRMMLGKEEKRAAAAIASSESGPVVLSVRDLALAPKLSRVSFDVHRGEVLGIAGLLGSGRTELLRAIAGLERPDAGHVHVRGKDVTRLSYHELLRHGIGFTPENRKDEGIIPLLGVDENTVFSAPGKVSRHGVMSARAVKGATSEIIRRMDIKAPRTTTPIGALSGGNQQKAVIGRWVFAQSDILLLDEPTRGVDVEAKSQIYEIIRALAAGGKSIVFVSSEVEELPQVCDRVIVLRDGEITEEFIAGSISADEIMSASIGAHG